LFPSDSTPSVVLGPLLPGRLTTTVTRATRRRSATRTSSALCIQTVCGTWASERCSLAAAIRRWVAIFSQITSPNITFSADQPLSRTDQARFHICVSGPASGAGWLLAVGDTAGTDELAASPSPPARGDRERLPPVALRECKDARLHLDPRCGGRQFYDICLSSSPPPIAPNTPFIAPLDRPDTGRGPDALLGGFAAAPTDRLTTFLVQARTSRVSSAGTPTRIDQQRRSVSKLVRPPICNSLEMQMRSFIRLTQPSATRGSC